VRRIAKPRGGNAAAPQAFRDSHVKKDVIVHMPNTSWRDRGACGESCRSRGLAM